MSTVPMSYNNNELTLSAPLSGPVLTLGDVPDEVFASHAMGDGIAKGPFSFGALGICVNPLMIVSRIGKKVNLRLGDFEIF